MIVTYNWLKEFVDCDLPPQELSHLLTMLGLEVDRMEVLGAGMDDVVVALVEERAQHPNADKLSLCKVNNGKEVLSIVCGAQNFKTGDKVALAQIGATLPGDFKIKRSKIRGEESFGMLCSEKELGLAAESAGIMILPENLTLGTPVFDALGLKDTIFEIGLTPNRADCLSVIGVAREVAAKLGKKVHYPGLEVHESGAPIETVASVTIDAPELCPRYTARYIGGCQLAPSPAWLSDRLRAAGIRSINNIVDVTNYVLLEYGHPLHAFDYRLLSGGKIIVAAAGEGERFHTLDGQERVLTSADLTIRDAEKGVALAGIMGGGNSEIGDNTTDVLLESAYFNPSAIRKTSKRLGIHTESSHRFERGTDVAGLTRALDRAAQLVAELSGGSVAKGTIDVYPQPVEPRTISARLEKINAITGLSLSAAEVEDIFQRLEFTVSQTSPGVFQVTVPLFRVDLEREIDLVEEVVRLHGFENVPTTMPNAAIYSHLPSEGQQLLSLVKNLLVGQGLSEVINYSFVAPSSCDRILLPQDDFRRCGVKLLNPLSDELSVMRTTLLPGLLETVVKNISFRTLNQRIFEMRRIYIPTEGEELPQEPIYLAALFTGSRDLEGWNQAKGGIDFYDVKGVVENILDELHVGGVSYASDELDPYFHPGKACRIVAGRTQLGSFGELHPSVQENYGIEAPVYYLEINFEKLVKARGEMGTAQVPSRFPSTFRDIAMLVPDVTAAAEIVACVKGVKAPELEGVEIFDVYKGANIAADQKSIAIRVRYGSKERTLTDEEVSELHARVLAALQKKLNVTIR
ncbi:phenylalanine--tRNA ligase subunit beta [Geomesophilobacter sediminis]|uniref:Phenylalanine--tRNA ligase beta subunit n=1 Tax=Geomesophilobacter sediminis TaxID=2798584 RepID=A0A8J7LY09_9BACT|nr:phenylalanine--tRNA ligase subunit beta [Geomesophilobacter sediminis]MBJ6724066.1 phenylalanine--tRNA ligase subunit beta [Geomesophilobacter sediminis]